MKPRFQADADLDHDILSGVLRRVPIIDFWSALDAGLAGLDDLTILTIAANEDRILVTSDRRTMPRYFGKFLVSAESPGVIIVPQNLPISLSIEHLLLIWAASEHEEWANTIIDLPL